jgi:hypothetical protein
MNLIGNTEYRSKILLLLNKEEGKRGLKREKSAGKVD